MLDENQGPGQPELHKETSLKRKEGAEDVCQWYSLQRPLFKP